MHIIYPLNSSHYSIDATSGFSVVSFNTTLKLVVLYVLPLFCLAFLCINGRHCSLSHSLSLGVNVVIVRSLSLIQDYVYDM